jgi:tetratricopeptide (TPR) repeat protein
VSGRRLLFVLLPLLAGALLAQAARAHALLGASRRLRTASVVAARVAGAGERAAPIQRANLALLRRAAELDPADVRAPAWRGSLHLLLGNPHEAAAAYREALELEPRPEVHLNLARALLAAGELEGARRHFALAVRLDPALAPEVPAAGR